VLTQERSYQFFDGPERLPILREYMQERQRDFSRLVVYRRAASVYRGLLDLVSVGGLNS
jgi:hypothetical protein